MMGEERDCKMVGLKFEIQELRPEHLELRPQLSPPPEPLSHHTVHTYISQQNVGKGPTAAKSYRDTARTPQAGTPQGKCPSSTQTRPAPKTSKAACTGEFYMYLIFFKCVLPAP